MKASIPTRLWASSGLLFLCAAPTSNAQKEKGGDGGKGGKGSIFAIEYLPIGHLRTDPVISQECLSDHVHTFYGPPKIHPTVSYEELRSEDGVPHEATSGNVLENQSLYWHPSFYRTDPATGTRAILEPDWTTMYYQSTAGATTAFPEGFRMIGGPSDGMRPQCYGSAAGAAKAEYAKDDADYAKEKAEYYAKEGAAAGKGDAIAKEAAAAKGDYGAKKDIAGTDHLPVDPCAELAVPLVFPTCWDGTNLDSPDHRSHVVYAAGKDGHLATFGGGGTCPESHPVHLPEILMFLRFVDYPGGEVGLSNGPGGDWHADYVFGWDRPFLQGVLDGCKGMEHHKTKDIPCGASRLRDIVNLESTGVEPRWSEMAAVLRAARVPPAATGCTTGEEVDGVAVVPRGGCAGEVLSADACNQPAFPAHLLLAGGEGASSAARAAGAVLAAAAIVVASLVV